MINNISIKIFRVLVFTFLATHFSYAQKDTALVKIYFYSNEYTLTDASKYLLKDFIEQNKNHKYIKIIGRGDQHGSDALNDDLSTKRAWAVEDFLLKNGFPGENIVFVGGLGKRSPIKPESPHTDSLNRVVWITTSHELMHAGKITPKKISAYSLRDSLIMVHRPYPEFRTLYQSPQKGDTLRIDTTLTQRGDTLFIFRKLYIAEDLSPPTNTDPINANVIRDSLVWLSAPFPSEYLSPDQWPQKGDTLRIDTTLTQMGDTVLIARVLYIAEDNMQESELLVRKEVPRKTKKADLSDAFMDTLRNSRPGQAIIIRDLTFEFGYHVMPRTNLPALQAVSTALEKMPELKFDIRGHVCCVDEGKAPFEKTEDAFDKQTSRFDLSVNRAKEVYDFLVANGIDKTRLSYAGFGMKEPIVYPEKDKDDQYKNRRIEFFILAK